MAYIKHYELYGERETTSVRLQTAEAWTNSFHFEHIPARSSHYNWEIAPHVHDSFLQILQMNQGEARVTINGAQTNIKSPALVVIPAQNVHSFHFSPDVDGPVITIAQKPLEAITKPLMPELNRVLAQAWIIQLGQDKQADHALNMLLQSIEGEWRIHRYGHGAAGLGLLSTLLVHIARYTNQDISATTPLRQAAMVDKFKALVNEKFKSAYSVDDYAKRLGVSSGQLTRLTKQTLGRTALEVINTRILFEAERELTYTTDSIKQIAARLKFMDEAYFSRFFKKQTGQTPKEFRASKIRELD